MSVVVKVWPNDEIMYSYEIVEATDEEEGDGYRVWCSTGVLSGKYISDVMTLEECLIFMAEFIKEGEDL